MKLTPLFYIYIPLFWIDTLHKLCHFMWHKYYSRLDWFDLYVYVEF